MSAECGSHMAALLNAISIFFSFEGHSHSYSSFLACSSEMVTSFAFIFVYILMYSLSEIFLYGLGAMLLFVLSCWV